jgi:acyl carrier protein
MAIMQLSLIVEEEFGLRLPESLISRSTFESAGKLAEVIGQLQRA